MPFENDIFISYAHIDNEALIEGDKGWITNFHRALQIRLAQLLGRQPTIWRDKKLQGNDFFADKLVDSLPQVATILSVFSPRYLTSEWCRRELEEFVKAADKSIGARIAEKSRVFKVIKTPVPIEDHPQQTGDLLGYEFFTVDSQTGRARELDQKADPDSQRLYWSRLDDLAHDLAELLTILDRSGQGAGGHGAGQATSSLPVAKTEDAVTIYLADTTFDLRQERDVIKRELQGHGHVLLPDRQLPLIGPECEEAVSSDLAECRLSIHMVGRNYGIVPEGSVHSLVELQNEMALERGERGEDYERLVWMPPNLEPEDERQIRFIESLETDSRMQNNADTFRTPLEDFKTTLLKKLEPAKEEEKKNDDSAPAGEGNFSRIYLICDQRDSESTLPIEDWLFDQGFEVIVPVFDGDEAQIRREHEESMVACDAALIYYGAGNELWLRRKMRELQKSAGLGRKKPITAKAIYIAPPVDPRKKRFRTHEALVLQQQEDFSPETIKPFLDLLR